MTRPPPLPCTRCCSAIEADDLRCPVCFEVIDDAGDQAQIKNTIELLRCAGCGAAMEYQVSKQAAHCAFCGGSQKLEHAANPLEQAELFLPFQVDLIGARDAYRQWVSRQGWFRPFDLGSKATVESLQPMWWPGWVTDAQAWITWTADSDAGALNADWAPHAGDLHTEFAQLIIPATRGLSSAECAYLLPSYALQTATPFPAIAKNVPVVQERFDISRSQARSRIIAAIQRLAEQRVQKNQIPGKRIRNFHSSIQLRGLVTRRFAFPAYILAYRYRNRVYRTVISGQNPMQIIGQTPRSLLKVGLMVVLAVLMMGGIVGMLLRILR